MAMSDIATIRKHPIPKTAINGSFFFVADVWLILSDFIWH
jgi:hypothetical protein